jgi:hypothetical protein
VAQERIIIIITIDRLGVLLSVCFGALKRELLRLDDKSDTHLSLSSPQRIKGKMLMDMKRFIHDGGAAVEAYCSLCWHMNGENCH